MRHFTTKTPTEYTIDDEATAVKQQSKEWPLTSMSSADDVDQPQVMLRHWQHVFDDDTILIKIIAYSLLEAAARGVI